MAWHGMATGWLCMNGITTSSECLGMFERRGFAGVQALGRGRLGLRWNYEGLFLVLLARGWYVL